MTAHSQRAEELPRLRAALAQRLASADDAAFLVMLWALNAMKTARADEAGRFLGPYPPDAASDGIHGPHAIYPWELEALANELLVTEKSLYRVFRLTAHNPPEGRRGDRCKAQCAFIFFAA